jgi:hypothetical protein
LKKRKNQMRMTTGLMRLVLMGGLATAGWSSAATENIVLEERPLGAVLAAVTAARCPGPPPPPEVCARVVCNAAD